MPPRHVRCTDVTGVIVKSFRNYKKHGIPHRTDAEPPPVARDYGADLSVRTLVVNNVVNPLKIEVRAVEVEQSDFT